MGDNNAWHRHFGMGEVYNALQLFIFEFGININQRFQGVREMILLEVY